MKINHTVAHYVIGAAALGLASVAQLPHAAPVVLPASIHQVAKPSRHDWPSLGETKTIALGEALQGLKGQTVTIFCSEPSCHDFQLDLDDALQIAGWPSEFENRFVDSEADRGLFVGPPGPEADALINAIHETTGIEAKPVGIDGIAGLGIIIGKSGVNHEGN